MARSRGQNHRNGGHHNNNRNNNDNNNNNSNNNNNNSNNNNNNNGNGNGRSNRNNNRNTNNTRQECMLCGSTRHHQNQCIATGEEKQAYGTYKMSGQHGICIHCGKQGSHLPSNCFKRQNNNRNNTGGLSCGFCKKKTNHELADCPEVRKWTERADQMIEAALDAAPYCLLCGNAHEWKKCNYSSKGRRVTEFRNQATAVLTNWLVRSPVNTDSSLQNVSFCGYCESFCDHNTATCTESVKEYQEDKQSFLLARFGKVLGSDNYDKFGQNPMRPLVERKCQLCHTVLPKVINLGGHQDNMIVHCTNPRCGKQTVLLADNREDGRSRNNNTSGRKNSYWSDFNPKGYFARALGYDWWPFFTGHTVTCTAKGQPYYDGGPMTTALARLRPSVYPNNGLWTFNDPGNFQPFFPPASCQFTRQDINARNQSNNPVKNTRNGLIPMCAGCGLWGAVVDEDYDIVMTQSGSDMEGNLAGAGTGIIVFENPLYKLGGRNSPGETHYIARAQCDCTIKFGVAPNVVWWPSER